MNNVIIVQVTMIILSFVLRDEEWFVGEKGDLDKTRQDSIG